MKKTNTTLIKILTLVCVALMLAVIVLQFIPFWTVAGEEMSVAEYVWFPEHHKEATKQFAKDLSIPVKQQASIVRSAADTHSLVLALSLLGIFFCLTKFGKGWTSVFPAAAGIIGAIGYFTKPIFQIGSMWYIPGALCAAMAVAGLVILAITVIYVLSGDAT